MEPTGRMTVRTKWILPDSLFVKSLVLFLIRMDLLSSNGYQNIYSMATVVSCQFPPGLYQTTEYNA